MEFTKTPPKSDGGLFVKLKDKESVRGVFRGQPHEFFTHWLGNNKSEVCTENEDCVHCNNNVRRTFRFRLNFVVKEDDLFRMKIFEQGGTVYELLKELNVDYDLENYTVKITRNGAGKETTYTVLPLPKGEVSKESAEIFSKLPLNNLDPLTKEQDTPHPSETEDDVPF